LHPTHAWLERRFHGRASVSAALLTLATLLVILGPLTALGAAFAAQVAELLRYAQGYAAEHKPGAPSDLVNIPVVGRAIDWLQETVGVSLVQIQEWAVEAARTVLRFFATLGRQAFLGALGTVAGFVIMMFILFFAIRDGRSMFTTFRELVPMTPADKARLFTHLAAVTRAIVFGTGVTALVQGTLVAIAFAIVGLPSPIVFGVVAALFALIPMAGTPIVWVPAVIVLAVQGRYYAAIFLVVWGIFVTTIDNVLRPLLVAGRAPVGTLTVFIGVLGGVSALGPIGVFLGPLVLALVIALIRFTLEGRQTDISG
ncbi:MAG: AI-2E family transporter, partial [Pseudomonadota bacterium]|nr:AI-2E family transporter [Pseudomonadota bacterium]